VVLLVGDRAYKLKKPVDLGFLDFSTLEQRVAACHREVELNRRLSPDVYEGVGEIRDAAGEVVEPVVLMRRMPDERRLARLVAAGEVDPADLRAIARLVADFHSRCDRGPAVDADGTRDAVAHRWRANLDESRIFRGELLPEASFDAVELLSERFLAGRSALFEDRLARGAIVDGHGDLLADDIFCLPEGPRVLDCLDFDDRLRHLDRVDDLACLVMDLERLGAPEAGRLLAAHYLELSGDQAPPALLDHYVAYRAFMRAKVTCLRAEHLDAACTQGRLLLDIAERHLRDRAVTLVLVGGAPGTGKSTVATGLADAVGAVVLSSDRVRKELAGVPAEHHRPAAFGEGLYAEGWTDRTYQELLARAARLLGMGESVVIDATWSDACHRAAAADLARRTSSDLVQLCCDAPAGVAEERILSRPPGTSDADVATARRLRSRFAFWPEATQLSTVDAPATTVERARRLVRPGTTA
jgi:aminoglycoside phosphotransferase family enzyme/predicted kinase